MVTQNYFVWFSLYVVHCTGCMQIFVVASVHMRFIHGTQDLLRHVELLYDVIIINAIYCRHLLLQL